MPGQHDGHRERLRQAADNDPDLATFSQYQTLEYLLSFLIPRKDTNAIAHDLIDTFGGVNGVLHATMGDLFDIQNMTSNAARFLSTFYTFVRKFESFSNSPKLKMSNVQNAVQILKPYFYQRLEEHCYLAALDINDNVLQIAAISEGLADFTTIDTSRIITAVNRTRACKVILAHNHPGGSLKPSNQDLSATKTLYYVLQTLDTVLADHIIFTDDGYFSFYDNGWLDSMMLSSSSIYKITSIEDLRTKRANGNYIY